MRTPGHVLIAEGAPHVVNRFGDIERVGFSGVGGVGRGLCSCGELSPMYESSRKRRAWHRLHKEQMSS